MIARSLLGLSVLLLGACVSAPRGVPVLGSATLAEDFDSYTIRRVGVVPFSGTDDFTPAESTELTAAVFGELSSVSSYEVVPLATNDLAEVPTSQPYRRGWYRPETVLGIARRYQLDAILIGTVTDRQCFPPQRLAISVDLVAAETGMVIWSSAVQLDASQARTRRAVESWARIHLGAAEENEWELILLQPRRFMRFAAFQVSELL